MNIAVDSAGRGIDHLAGRAEPLYAAIGPATGRIGHGGVFLDGVRSVVSKIEKEWLIGIRTTLVRDPFLGAGREKVGSVTLVQGRRDAIGVVVTLFGSVTVRDRKSTRLNSSHI